MNITKCFNHLVLLSLSCWIGLAGLTSCTQEVTPPSLQGDVAQPAWTAPADYDYTSSMTAVVKVSLLEQYPSMAADWQLNDSDRVAAFVGDECLGVVTPQEGLFYLYVAGSTSSDQEQMTNVSLRYWSAHFKNLFEVKDAFPFKNDDHIGSVAEPFAPKFVVVKE